MNFSLVNKDGSLSCIKFKCLKSFKTYTITGTTANERGVLNSIDTILRDDDEKIKVKRKKLLNRFDNIEPINIFYESTVNKRGKTKKRR